MELVTYGWIGSSILAPTITAICVVVLFLFNVYKTQWRNVDHFLVCLTVQEIVSAVLCFGLSILNLLHNRNEQLCGLLTGLWFSIRMLQLVTLTSLLVDRALILKWPYQYRFSVRSLQIKSHLVFVSLCCSSIAIFAYSARLDQAAIQTVINELPATPNSISSNLAYFDLFSNPLFGGGSETSATNPGIDVTTPLSNADDNLNSNLNSILNTNSNRKSNQTSVQSNRSNDRLALPLRSSNDIIQLNSPQSIYSTAHLSSSLPPPFSQSQTNLPPSTVSMNFGQNSMLYKQFSVCSLHPLFWQRTFNIILLGLFAILTLVTIFCFIYVDCTRRCNQKRKLIAQTTYLSSSSGYLNKHKLTGVSVLDSNSHEQFTGSRYSNHLMHKATNQIAKTTNQLTNSSPGNTNTTTTTCASDHAHNQLSSSSTHHNHKSLNGATSLSTIALGDDQQQTNDKYDHTTGDSMSALCSMVDHDLTRSTDALASTKTDKKSKMHLLSKSQPSLLHNGNHNHLPPTSSSLDKKSNLSVYSFDQMDANKRRPRLDAKLNPLSNQLKYSSQLQFKSRLPVRSSSMYTTQNNHQLDNDNEPFNMQSREDLFSRKYLRDHYKICDLRWSSVVTCTSLCYAVNHAPSMVSCFFLMISFTFYCSTCRTTFNYIPVIYIYTCNLQVKVRLCSFLFYIKFGQKVQICFCLKAYVLNSRA